MATLLSYTQDSDKHYVKEFIDEVRNINEFSGRLYNIRVMLVINDKKVKDKIIKEFSCLVKTEIINKNNPDIQSPETILVIMEDKEFIKKAKKYKCNEYITIMPDGTRKKSFKDNCYVYIVITKSLDFCKKVPYYTAVALRKSKSYYLQQLKS